MSSITVYGIPNCDTVKRARAWFTAQGIDHRFHDFRKAGLPPQQLDAWLASTGWETLLNRRGTTWRGLALAAQQTAVDTASAHALILAHPSLIKRPVVEWTAGRITVGFDAAAWAALAHLA